MALAMTEAMTSNLRIATRVARAALDPDRPLVTHLVITRRCNLACGYCVEYDHVSQPVPAAATCPVAYAHHASRLDTLRSQRGAPIALDGPSPLVRIRSGRSPQPAARSPLNVPA